VDRRDHRGIVGSQDADGRTAGRGGGQRGCGGGRTGGRGNVHTAVQAEHSVLEYVLSEWHVRDIGIHAGGVYAPVTGREVEGSVGLECGERRGAEVCKPLPG